MKTLGVILLSVYFLAVGYSSAQTLRTLSVHVLDNGNGSNAPNMTCKLFKKTDGEFVLLSTQVTNGNGRIPAFISVEEYVAGVYQVWCDTKSYYNAKGIQTLWPAIQVTWKTANPQADHHVPIAISPYAFSTYHGT